MTPPAPTAYPPGPLSTTPNHVAMHRACDGCRTRKLACSKEPTGCSRCKREGIACVYSAQKPMGRPKKRKHSAQHESDEPSHSWSPLDGATGNAFPEASVTGFSSLGKSVSDYETLDMMRTLNLPFSMPPQSQILVDPFLDMDMSLFQPDGLGGLGLHGAGHGAQDDIELSKGSVHHIFEAIGTFIFSNNGSTPQPSPGPGAETPLPGGPAPATTNESKAWPNANCPCLSIAYMALESLNNMPADLPVAINVTRNAAKTAHDLIQCPICSAPLVDNPLARPPIQSPQNMFLLSALLLSLANAYTRILEIVDTTTAEAKAGARELHFSFCDLGGVWKQLDVTRGGSCMLSRGLYEADLPPELWRLAMRAVIRFEIYGLSQKDNAGTDARHPPQQQDNHPGLASALRGVEERSLKRHMKLDELVEKGHEPQDCDTPHVFLKDLKEGEKPQCMWLVEGARIALDKLTIT